jgi:hypothetical protein
VAVVAVGDSYYLYSSFERLNQGQYISKAEVRHEMLAQMYYVEATSVPRNRCCLGSERIHRPRIDNAFVSYPMITSCHPAVLDTCESLNWEATSFRGERVRVQDSKLSSGSARAAFDSLDSQAIQHSDGQDNVFRPKRYKNN